MTKGRKSRSQRKESGNKIPRPSRLLVRSKTPTSFSNRTPGPPGRILNPTLSPPPGNSCVQDSSHSLPSTAHPLLSRTVLDSDSSTSQEVHRLQDLPSLQLV